MRLRAVESGRWPGPALPRADHLQDASQWSRVVMSSRHLAVDLGGSGHGGGGGSNSDDNSCPHPVCSWTVRDSTRTQQGFWLCLEPVPSFKVHLIATSLVHIKGRSSIPYLFIYFNICLLISEKKDMGEREKH